jgi:hypothetical protein
MVWFQVKKAAVIYARTGWTANQATWYELLRRISSEALQTQVLGDDFRTTIKAFRGSVESESARSAIAPTPVNSAPPSLDAMRVPGAHVSGLGRQLMSMTGDLHMSFLGTPTVANGPSHQPYLMGGRSWTPGPTFSSAHLSHSMQPMFVPPKRKLADTIDITLASSEQELKRAR